MGKKVHPVTPAIRVLRDNKIPFKVHLYPYAARGGARQAAAALGLPEQVVIKTLVFQDERKNGLLVLMHGNQQVSAKQLARQLHLKKALPCEPQRAMQLTGYKVGGISPFGTRTSLPVFVESTITALERIYINGGKRGMIVQISPACLKGTLKATPVTVALDL